MPAASGVGLGEASCVREPVDEEAADASPAQFDRGCQTDRASTGDQYFGVRHPLLPPDASQQHPLAPLGAVLTGHAVAVVPLLTPMVTR